MKVAEIRYGRKINLGNYNTENIELVAVLDDGEDELEAMAKLKKQVDLAKTK